MQQDDLWMSNLMPAQDREVRALLDSGDSAAAEIAFARMTDARAGLVGPQWNRSLVDRSDSRIAGRRFRRWPRSPEPNWRPQSL